MVDTQTIVKLRKQTGAGMVDCKKALEEAGGDYEKAIEVLRKKGEAKAAKKINERDAGEGIVYAYIHANGKVGAMLELNSETDFVARTDDFQQLVKDVAMQVAASSPRFVNREEVTEKVLEQEKEIYRSQAAATGKPEKVIEKIFKDLYQLNK